MKVGRRKIKRLEEGGVEKGGKGGEVKRGEVIVSHKR